MVEKQLRVWLYGDHSEQEHRASKATHDLSNAVMKLDAVTWRMKRSGDPWNAFVKAVRGSPNGEDTGATH